MLSFNSTSVFDMHYWKSKKSDEGRVFFWEGFKCAGVVLKKISDCRETWPFSLNPPFDRKETFTPSVIRIAVFSNNCLLQEEKPVTKHIQSCYSFNKPHSEIRYVNLQLGIALMSGGLSGSNKRCSWINRVRMPCKHRQTLSDDMETAAHGETHVFSSNKAWHLSSTKTHVCVYGH